MRPANWRIWPVSKYRDIPGLIPENGNLYNNRGQTTITKIGDRPLLIYSDSTMLLKKRDLSPIVWIDVQGAFIVIRHDTPPDYSLNFFSNISAFFLAVSAFFKASSAFFSYRSAFL